MRKSLKNIIEREISKKLMALDGGRLLYESFSSNSGESGDLSCIELVAIIGRYKSVTEIATLAQIYAQHYSSPKLRFELRKLDYYLCEMAMELSNTIIKMTAMRDREAE